MLIKTSEPILDNGKTIVQEIAQFWDKISSGWHKTWGPHIHHGYYDVTTSISPIDAQEILLEKLSFILEIQPKSKILDVGCGLGGSSRYLAEKFNAVINAITLSKEQIKIANKCTPEKLSGKISYHVEDAHQLKKFPSNYFDIVWSLESCEQFYDKHKFIEESLRVLKPDGKLMIATWCSDKEIYMDNEAKNYAKICTNFQLPYMPTMSFYQDALAHKFELVASYDWTPYVKQNWEIGIAYFKKLSWLKIFRMGGLTGLHFIRNLKLMNQGFKSGQIRYGVFIARKK